MLFVTAHPLEQIDWRQREKAMAAAEFQTTVLVPGSLHPSALRLIGDAFRLVRIERADAALVTPELAREVTAVATSKRLERDFVKALPNLEIVANFGVGYDKIDVGACAEAGVVVTNTPDVLTEEVADTAIGLLINTVRELPRAETWLRQGRWERDGDYPLTAGSLRGRKAGIFGMGRIGRAVARRLEAFGLPVAYHNRHAVADLPYDYHPSLLDLAEAVDILISIAPGGEATRGAVDAAVLRALGPQGVFVNIGRGSTVDEPALVEALENGTIFAAGLDVFAHEPHVPTALLKLPNVSLLPHVGSASQQTREMMAQMVANNLVAWFSEGRALTPVSETASLAVCR